MIEVPSVILRHGLVHGAAAVRGPTLSPKERGEEDKHGPAAIHVCFVCWARNGISCPPYTA